MESCPQRRPIRDDRDQVCGAGDRRRIRPEAPAIRGQARNEETGKRAAEIATRGAVTLRHNAYKIPLMQNLVKRAIRGDAAWTS